MGGLSSPLYDEFLDHYHLDPAMYMHALEISKKHFAKIDTLKVLTFKKVQIPVSEAVKNSVTFRNELHMSQITAERELKKILHSFRQFRMDEDDVGMMCDRLEMDILGKLLWPFHLLAVEAELEKKDFYPIANMMEGIVCDFLDTIDHFCQAFMDGELRIRHRTQAEIEEKNRQTRNWAANAPVEVRGSARVIGDRLQIEANVRSTVTQGQIAADYQVNQLVANRDANRKRDAQQKNLMDYLESGLMEVVKRYIPAWYDCLEHNLGFMVGKNVITSTIYGKASNTHPHLKEHAIKLFNLMTEEDDFSKIEYFLRYYDHDFYELFGDSVAARIINSYVKTKQVDENELSYRFFCHFYNKQHPVEHTALFNCLKKKIQKQVRDRCEAHYKRDPAGYCASICEAKLGAYFRFFDAIPGLTVKQRRTLSNACFYIFYDVKGDTNFRDIYDEKKGVPVFDWTPDD